MTVQQLIEWLQKQDPVLEVMKTGSLALTTLKEKDLANLGWAILIKD